MSFKEIEIKVQLEQTDAEKVRALLEKDGTFIKETHHEEYYLNDPSRSFLFPERQTGNFLDAKKYLRVRFTAHGAHVNFKDWQLDVEGSKAAGYDVHSHCNESEVVVEDGHAMLQLLAGLGYTEKTLVDKYRKTYHYGDFVIELDEVKGLGYFVEVEWNGGEIDPVEAKSRMYDFFRQLGIESLVTHHRGYVSMLWNPNFDFGERVSL